MIDRFPGKHHLRMMESIKENNIPGQTCYNCRFRDGLYSTVKMDEWREEYDMFSRKGTDGILTIGDDPPTAFVSCRRFPPTFVAIPLHVETVDSDEYRFATLADWRLPLLTTDDWCGEWIDDGGLQSND